MGKFELIPDFFDGRDVFITGGSGLIGKTLIEKILYSCSTVNKIFVLLRSKGGRNVEERLECLKKSDVFQRIRTKAPDLFDKMEAVEGDICERGLGANVLATQERLANVSVIIHGAASVRFDDPLIKAVNINICGTREILDFAEKLPKLKVFFHISTTFCYPEYKFLQEKLFPPSADWRKILAIVENLDEEVVYAMEQKIIGHQPNTYTFTKNLSEHLVYEYRHKVPIVIYRPSIMTPAVMEPFAGWNDNVNGPVGIMMATGSGLIRTLFTDPKIVLDFNPIDVTVKGMIIAIKRQGVRSIEEIYSSDVPIYNGSSGQVNPVTYYELAMLGNSCIPMVPFDYFVWPISFIATTWFLHFYIRLLFLQLAPSILIDFVIRLAGRPPIVMKLQRRLYLAQISLAYFMRQRFEFENANHVSLLSDLRGSDVDCFSFSYYKDVDHILYFVMCILGSRRHILGQKDDTLPLARRRFNRMVFLRNTLQTLFYAFIVWFGFNYYKKHYALAT
ncbi:putative fatty acyl-CoA reductase CG5065 [Phlebotomus argentipes]|uniref:putative fatty acyl-CoA reductase CG5065 n=1 Tax=Phlebotomus argentipes TaxID=94469 RepID=UPI0028933520|nr:putative fatty acyl-CoA reductase CG5065 [Phlebotomus argentipes]